MDVTQRETLERRLRELLASHASIKIATSSPSGEPWISTAYFLDENLFALAFMIEPRGRTLTNMKANPRVAVMLENGDAMALFAQAEGHVTMVAGARERFRDGIAAKTPTSAALVGLPELVPVRIEVTRWKLTDVPGGWLPARELLAPKAKLAVNE